MKTLIWLFLGLFIYPYLIYPLILKLWIKSLPNSKNKHLKLNLDLLKEKWPKTTLLITAFNEEQFIREKIENSLALDYPNLEIIIVSDGSNDKTNSILAEYQNKIKSIILPNRVGKPMALSQGLKYASGEIICLSDVSALYTRDSIQKLVVPLLNQKIGATGGILSLKKQDQEEQILGEVKYSDYESNLRKLESSIAGTIVLPGTFYAVRRENLTLPLENIIADDFFITCSLLKRGFNLIQVENAVAFEQSSYNTSDEFLRKSRIIAGGIQTIFHFPELLISKWGFFLVSHKLLRWTASLFGIIHYLLLAVTKLYPTLFVLESIFILLGFLGYIIEKGGLKSPRIIALIKHFLVVNIAVFWGFFGLLSGRQTVKWKR